jgi:hypothetical protein
LTRVSSASVAASPASSAKVKSDSTGAVTISKPGRSAITAASSCDQATWSRMRRRRPEAVGAQREPELERAEAPAQRHRPLVEVGDAVGPFVPEGLQVLGAEAERADLRDGVGEELHRAVELRAEPLVRVEHDAVGAVDAAHSGRNSGQIMAEPAQAASTWV